MLDRIVTHNVKNVLIQSFSGPYFPALGLNTERHSLSLSIQSKRGKIRTRKTRNKDTFQAITTIQLMGNIGIKKIPVYIYDGSKYYEWPSDCSLCCYDYWNMYNKKAWMFLEVLNTNYGHLGIYSKEYFSTDYTKSLTRMFLVDFISISNLDI